jgi:hypothetical protein
MLSRCRETCLPAVPFVAGDLVEELQDRAGVTESVFLQATCRPRGQIDADAMQRELRDIRWRQSADVEGVHTVAVREEVCGRRSDVVGKHVGHDPDHEQGTSVRSPQRRRQRLQRLDIRVVRVVDDDHRHVVDPVEERACRLHRVAGRDGLTEQLFEHGPGMVGLPACPGGVVDDEVVVASDEIRDEGGFSDAGCPLDEDQRGNTRAGFVEEAFELHQLGVPADQHTVVRHTSTVVGAGRSELRTGETVPAGRGTNQVTRPPASAIPAKM